jgi:AcrR family transcriptional regulator
MMNSGRQMVPAGKRRSGRRVGQPDTRAAILNAARALFGEKGLSSTSVRAVAARAGVDPALVLHFFGSKAGLFDAALDVPLRPELLLPILQGPRAGLGERLVRFYVTQLFEEQGALVAALIRSAVSDAEAAARLRSSVEQGPLALVVQASGDPTIKLRAEMVATMMLGLFLGRRIVGIEPLASTSAEELIARYAPIAQRLLAPGPQQPRAARAKTAGAEVRPSSKPSTAGRAPTARRTGGRR